MVLGEELLTGGKALESDIVGKKLEFFKSLGNHIQDIGVRNVVSISLPSTGTQANFFTVSENKTVFLTHINIAGHNNSVVIGEVTVVFPENIGSELRLFLMSLGPSGGFDTKSVTFADPLKFNSGEALDLQKNVGASTMVVHGQVIFYELDKEISLQ